MRRPALRPLRRRALICTLGALTASLPARAANSVSLEVGAGESKPTPTIPSSAFEYQKIVGRLEPTDVVYVTASVRAQHDFIAPATAGTTLETGSDWVWLGTLDANWDVTKHLTLGAGFDGSPSSTRAIAAPFSYPGSAPGASAVMQATSSNVGANFDVLLDSFDEDEPPRDLDVSLDLSLGYLHYATDQSMTALDAPGGQPLTAQAFEAGCGARATALCNVVARAAQDSSSALEQFRLEATPTLTILEDTDVALDAAYYAYDKNHPDQIGYFGGRRGQVTAWGAGLPLVPAQWTLRPEVGHKWKALSVRGWYQLSDYTIPSYIGHAVGAKVQLYTDKWRFYLTGSYRADVSTNGTEDNAQTWTAGIGVTRVF